MNVKDFNVINNCWASCFNFASKYQAISESLANVIRTLAGGDRQQRLSIYCGDTFASYYDEPITDSNFIGYFDVLFGQSGTPRLYRVYHDETFIDKLIVVEGNNGRRGLVIIK